MLTFNLKKEWFEKIKSGEKTHEYREVKPYWTKRLMFNLYGYAVDNERYFISMCNGGHKFLEPIFPKIEFACGYPTFDDNSRRLNAEVKSIRIVNGKNTDLKIDKPVYDIEFEVIK